MMRLLRFAGYAAILAWLAWLLHAYWRAGALTSWSFWILGAVVVFELSCVAYLLRGFRAFRDDPYRIELEERRAAARAPKKRYGNAPVVR